MFRTAAVLAAAALMTFAGCTKVDDTLGSNLVPDNQQMKVGYTTLGARTLAGKLDAAKYVETRLSRATRSRRPTSPTATWARCSATRSDSARRDS